MALLDLPTCVRRRIFEYILVRDDCPIDLSFWASRSYQTPEELQYQQQHGMHQCWRRASQPGQHKPHNRTCVCPAVPVALLRVCRVVHAEAVRVLYGQNRFVLRGRTFSLTHGDAGGNDNHDNDYRLRRLPCADQFAPLLMAIPLYGLASMGSLLVRLNCWPCPLGHEETGFTYRYRTNPFEHVEGGVATGYCRFCNMRSDRADEPLVLRPATDGSDDSTVAAEDTGAPVPTNDESMMQVWDDVCARLAAALETYPQDKPLLDLTVISDVGSVEAAERVVSPLKRAVLPASRLRDCTIRLGRRRRDFDLKAVAQQAVLALTTGADTRTNATDTTDTTATQKTESRHIFPFYRLPAELRVKILEYTDLGRVREVKFRDRRPLFRSTTVLGAPCCSNCTDARMDCCCPRYYASVSAHCTCVILPVELFLVDRQMYREAAHDVLYAKTAFAYESDTFAMTLEALQQLTPATLRRMTTLHIVVSGEQFPLWRKSSRAFYVRHYNADGQRVVSSGAWTYDPHRGDTTWASLIAFIRDHMDLPRLTLHLDVRDCIWDRYEFYVLSEAEDEMPASFHEAYCMYMDLVTVLCTLEELKGFRMHSTVYCNLEPWLVRQVLGDRDPYKGGLANADVEVLHSPATKRRPNRFIPSYHDVNIPLPGSHWHPEKSNADLA
ncbi:uncharacterized protein SPSK_03165 [Sporothrix schenckii 1099-18]|uniref:Uncharacterized protein n=1 Tax=Sporothrix schenckii 1099-18 TaxID=1397361 RepID=A0A0F2LYW2_SPOSC|nr:uncharacterized protein SPSK_03165 [Sporothrix schenckii 1099-18]KJR82019.1 hypothetical protein SPSK_03165 [Sporothrix schenckii 1099-18]